MAKCAEHRARSTVIHSVSSACSVRSVTGRVLNFGVTLHRRSVRRHPASACRIRRSCARRRVSFVMLFTLHRPIRHPCHRRPRRSLNRRIRLAARAVRLGGRLASALPGGIASHTMNTRTGAVCLSPGPVANSDILFHGTLRLESSLLGIDRTLFCTTFLRVGNS